MPSLATQADRASLDDVQGHVWNARLPLEIKLAASESRLYHDSEPYLISFPRLSYLPFLLPRLVEFYAEEFIAEAETVSPDVGYFTFEGVPLKWHLPVGLLYDMNVLSASDIHNDDEDTLRRSKQDENSFKLIIHFSTSSISAKHFTLINPTPAIVHDTFINSVKEADFLRSGSAKPIMSMNAEDSRALWTSTQENDLTKYAKLHASLLPRDTPWRNIPLRIYLPATTSKISKEGVVETDNQSAVTYDQLKVVQSQVAPIISTYTSNPTQLRAPSSAQTMPQTVGTALHSLLPSLFPSRRAPIMAKPLLHGAVLPMNAVLEEVASKACYADGWVNIVIAITS